MLSLYVNIYIYICSIYIFYIYIYIFYIYIFILDCAAHPQAAILLFTAYLYTVLWILTLLCNLCTTNNVIFDRGTIIRTGITCKKIPL